ncbi:hypothetical protein AUK22_11900 [bacterium CG2_30_54_10]|nr:MAG: hypothetical protein AUK22_11900 [bacterium CG2_30_54_10]
MRICFLSCVLCLLFLFPAAVFAYGHYSVYSTVPAEVYVDNEYRATISATQSLKLILSGPQSYVIGVRATATGQTYKETVNVGSNLNEHRDIRAFSEIDPTNNELTVTSPIPADVYIDNVFKAYIDSNRPMGIVLPGPGSYFVEVRAKNTAQTYKETVNVGSNFYERHDIRAFSQANSKNNELTVYSPIPANVFVDNVSKGYVDSAKPLVVILPGPGSYIVEVRAQGSKLTQREEIIMDSKSEVGQEIRAFSVAQAPVVMPVDAGAPAPAPVPQGGISREEMASAIQAATAKAKAEALAEEAGRRKRAEKRAVISKGIAHVVGVEANRGLPNSVKNMERIKLLMEALPSFGK